MNLTTALGHIHRWWPSLAALILLLFSIPVMQYATPLTAMSMVPVALSMGLVRFHPIVALSLAALGVIVATSPQSFAGEHVLPRAAGLFTLALATAQYPNVRGRLWVGLAGVATGLLTGFLALVSRTAIGGWMPVADWLWTIAVNVAVPMVVWAIAFSVRTLRDMVEVERSKHMVEVRSSVVESELRDERLRTDLTHEFHDVMAHSLAVLAAQAEGLRLSYKEHPERIEPVLTTISDTARLGLVEVRSMLERVEDDSRRPQPTAVDIPALIDQTRAAGTTVHFFDAGRHGTLTQLGHIASYRIVQEALTNALRHGSSNVEIRISLTWTGPGLSIAVASPLADTETLRPPGRGISGMHERAKQAGGWVDIDSSHDQFVVTAYLPYQEPDPAGSTAPLGENQLHTVPQPLMMQPKIIDPRRLQPRFENPAP